MNGRQRHRVVDTTGLVDKALVPAANVPDGTGGQRVREAIPDLAQALPRRRQLWVETAYHGRFTEGVEPRWGWTVTVVRRPRRGCWVSPGGEPPEVPRGFPVLPRRWVVERTFGWLGRWRRTSKEYAYLPATSDASSMPS